MSLLERRRRTESLVFETLWARPASAVVALGCQSVPSRDPARRRLVGGREDEGVGLSKA